MSLAKMIELFRKYQDDPEMQVRNVLNQYGGCFRNGELIIEKVKMEKGIEPPSDKELQLIFKLIRLQKKHADAGYGDYKRWKSVFTKIDEFENYVRHILTEKQLQNLFKPAPRLTKTKAFSEITRPKIKKTSDENTQEEKRSSAERPKIKV